MREEFVPFVGYVTRYTGRFTQLDGAITFVSLSRRWKKNFTGKIKYRQAINVFRFSSIFTHLYRRLIDRSNEKS